MADSKHSGVKKEEGDDLLSSALIPHDDAAPHLVIPDLRQEMEDALQGSISSLPSSSAMSPDQLQIYASAAFCKDAVAPFYAPSNRLSLSFRNHLFVLTPSAIDANASSLYLLDLKPLAVSNKSPVPKVKLFSASLSIIP